MPTNINLRALTLCSAMAMALSTSVAAEELSIEEQQRLYEQAYIYALPINMSYKTMYAYAIDQSGANFKASFNQIKNTARVYGPQDTAVVSANSDTPYSLLWMDLRAEPVVVCVPKVDKTRYYSAMFQDLSTNLLPYMGTRTTGSDGSCSLVTGPSSTVDTVPEGINQTIRSKSEFVITVFRTQLFDASDLEKVQKVQQGYSAQTLSQYANTQSPKSAPKIDFPKWNESLATGQDFISLLNFNLQFISPSEFEQDVLDTLAAIGVGAGNSFEFNQLSPEQQKALNDGVASAQKKIADKVAQLPGPLGYTEADYKADWLKRAAVTQLGWGANSEKEALYPNYAKDQHGQVLDGSKGNYSLTFKNGELPPVNAFWSLTMYDGATQLMIDNELDRYLLNSTMIENMTPNSDGSLTLYFQKEMSEESMKSNWLPAPDGPFYMLLRLYWPKQEIIEGTWKPPVIIKQEDS